MQTVGGRRRPRVECPTLRRDYLSGLCRMRLGKETPGGGRPCAVECTHTPYVPPRLANIAHPKVTDVGQAWRILLGCITHPIGPGPSTSKCDSALPHFPRHFPFSGYPRFSKTGDLLKRYVKHRWHFSTSDTHVSAATTPIVQLVTFVPACSPCTFSFWDFGHHMCTCQCL